MTIRFSRLAALGDKPARTILGLMSGTSLDGLDLALCRITGHGAATRCDVLHFVTRPYTVTEKTLLREVAFQEQVSLRQVCELNGWLAEWHARAINAQLAEWGVAASAVDAIASHGQTIFHAPTPGGHASFETLAESILSPAKGLAPQERGPADRSPEEGRRSRPVWKGGQRDDIVAGHTTLQIGDADRLAVRTGILTISDFRQKEIAGGGQGAPLAPYGDALLFAAPTRSRILLNLGGIANFTWLPPHDPIGRWVSSDTGPGNTLIDRVVRLHFPEQADGYDRDGALAAMGKADARALARAKAHPYFARPFPKSTGPEDFGPEFFSMLEAASPGHDREHALGLVALCTRLSAETIADALRATIHPLQGAELFASGGGAHNRTLMRWLAELLPEVTLADTAALGVPPDAKEAVLFAVLANETLAGAGFPARDGSGRKITFGKISLPE